MSATLAESPPLWVTVTPGRRWPAARAHCRSSDGSPRQLSDRLGGKLRGRHGCARTAVRARLSSDGGLARHLEPLGRTAGWWSRETPAPRQSSHHNAKPIRSEGVIMDHVVSSDGTRIAFDRL